MRYIIYYAVFIPCKDDYTKINVNLLLRMRKLAMVGGARNVLSLNEAHCSPLTAMAGVRPRDEDLDSEFDYAPEKRRKTWRDDPIATQKPPHVMHVPSHSAALPSKELLTRERDKEEWRSRRFHLLAMDAYSRHKALVNQYLLATGRGIEHVQRSTKNDRNDYSVLREQHKFLMTRWIAGKKNWPRPTTIASSRSTLLQT